MAMDARRLSYHGGNVISYAEGTLETQSFLRTLAKAPGIPAGADEILRVEQMKENPSHYALVCRVRHPNRRVIRRTYFLVKGMEDQELLLRQLERREQGAGVEGTENRKPFYILLSGLICCGFGVLCVLSHPAVARASPKHLLPLPGCGLCGLVLYGLVWNPAAPGRVNFIL